MRAAMAMERILLITFPFSLRLTGDNSTLEGYLEI